MRTFNLLGVSLRCRADRLQGYLAHKKLPPAKDHRRSLGIVLLWGPMGALLLMSEVPLYEPRRVIGTTA